jgi:prepilin-type N-terminal cleavage/methylation domain-containing protein
MHACDIAIGLRRTDARVRGFTMIELLVVIAIVGLLAAIIIPNLSKARERAESARLTSNLRQMGAALISYAGEHNSLVPLAGGSIPYVLADDPTTPVPWQQALDDYGECGSQDFFVSQ